MSTPAEAHDLDEHDFAGLIASWDPWRYEQMTGLYICGLHIYVTVTQYVSNYHPEIGVSDLCD